MRAPHAACTEGAGLPRRGPACAGCADGHRSQRHRGSAINNFSCAPPGPAPGSCPRFLPSCPGPGAGSSRAPLGSNWRLRLQVALEFWQRSLANPDMGRKEVNKSGCLRRKQWEKYFGRGSRGGGATTERTGGSTKGNAPHCTPKTAEFALLHAPLSTRLGEISSR
jgi:hypothetical protein